MKTRENADGCDIVLWFSIDSRERVMVRESENWRSGSKPGWIFHLISLFSRFVQWKSAYFVDTIQNLAPSLENFWMRHSVCSLYNFHQIETRSNYTLIIHHFYLFCIRLICPVQPFDLDIIWSARKPQFRAYLIERLHYGNQFVIQFISREF